MNRTMNSKGLRHKKDHKCVLFCRNWLYTRWSLTFVIVHTQTVTQALQSKTRSLVLVSIWRAAQFPLPSFPSRPDYEHKTVTESLKMTFQAMCNDLTIKLWNAVCVGLELVKDTGSSRSSCWHRMSRRLECVPGVALMFFVMYIKTIIVVRDVMPCSSVDKFWRFGTTYCVSLLPFRWRLWIHSSLTSAFAFHITLRPVSKDSK